MYYELSKPDKKIARACIDKGLNAQMRECLEASEAILANWRSGKFPTAKDAYHHLYSNVWEKDKAIARRYDGLGGSRWLDAVVAILRDGYIDEDDIAGFSEETKFTIERWLGKNQ